MDKKLLEQQKELEEFYLNKSREAVKKALENGRHKGVAATSRQASGLKLNLAESLAINIENFIEENTVKKKCGVVPLYRPLLQALLDEVGLQELTLISTSFLLNVVINNCFKGSANTSRTATIIGYAIYTEVRLANYLKSHKYYEKGFKQTINNSARSSGRHTLVDDLLDEKGHEFYKPPIEVRSKTFQSLGLQLLDILVKSSDLFEYAVPSDKRSSHLVPTQKLIDLWDDAELRQINDTYAQIPTIIPPKPWTSIGDGAYYGSLQGATSLIRVHPNVVKTKLHKRYLNKLRDINLDKIYKAINRIQETPYTVNKTVMGVLEHIRTLGGGRAGIAPLDPQPYNKRKMTYGVYRQSEIKRRSKALYFLNTLKMAQDFSQYEHIYFPCNMDFRGRIYPMPSFNHQGNDVMKGLLHYANPVPCKNETDINLLKVQGANLWGNDKVSLIDRIKWIDENHEHIVESAVSPLSYRWWEDADEPVQFLAFCIEYKRAIDYMADNNGSLIGFKCNIVIAYDGTCSGLQHFSALLRDRIGGTEVNLIDHDKPSDIYQSVANTVNKMLEEDALNGTGDTPVENNSHIWGTKTLAQTWLAYGVTRKVCKRPVMTLAYGSAVHGFTDQIIEDTTKDEPMFINFKKPAARYLAECIWSAVKMHVVSAVEGMKCLKKIASAFTSENVPVSWVTPLGLPVQQSYLKAKRNSFRTRLGTKLSMPLYYEEIDPQERISKIEQRNGVSPNFIHSLDATHLMLVVLNTPIQNFTTVHDSFGTSLGEAKELRQSIRQQLYLLYTEHKPLETFIAHAEEILGHPLDIELPPMGDLDLKEILKSSYAFH